MAKKCKCCKCCKCCKKIEKNKVKIKIPNVPKSERQQIIIN